MAIVIFVKSKIGICLISISFVLQMLIFWGFASKKQLMRGKNECNNS